MLDKKIEGDAEIELGRTLSDIAGQVFIPKTAAEGTPEEQTQKPMVKKAGLVKKATDMSLRELFEHEEFQRGVGDMIDAQRFLWEPQVENMVRERLEGE